MWCRRTDELVDGPNASYITPTALDRWEKRLEDLFEGRPYDMYDAALSDTVSKFPVDIQVNPSVRPSVHPSSSRNKFTTRRLETTGHKDVWRSASANNVFSPLFFFSSRSKTWSKE